MITLRTILSISSLLIISNCAIYKSQFDCPPGKSVGCKSVSYVNELVNDDLLDGYLGEPAKQVNKAEDNNYPKHSKNKAQNEKVTIWFNEYQDSNNVVHDSHTSHIFF